LKKLEPDATALLRLIERWRNEAVRAGRPISRIALAYEAGRDGFWLARWLIARGIEAYVIHSAKKQCYIEAWEENRPVAEQFANEIGLLRTIVRNLERTPVPVDPTVAAYCRAQGIELPSADAGWKTTIRPAGHNAFNELSECLVAHSAAVERGTNFANFQTELFSQLEAYVGRDPGSVACTDARQLVDHFTAWFKRHASPRRVFVPCVLTPWAAPRFEIGSVTVIYIDEITTSEFYPAGPAPDVLAKQNFDTMLELMRDTRANWLARAGRRGTRPCDRRREGVARPRAKPESRHPMTADHRRS
jgi:hypothetical protein